MTAKTPSNRRNNNSDQKRADDAFVKKKKEIEDACPESTSSERHRFLYRNHGDVKTSTEKLRGYLDWRKRCHSHSDSSETNEANSGPDVSDKKAWESSVSTALAMSTDESKTSSDESSSSLPQLVRFDCHDGSGEMFDRDGHRIIQVLPAQLDDKLASASTYAQCVALYLDRRLDRNSMEKITVVIDLRGGPGWANPNPTSVVPFIKEVSSLLTDYLPCRLYRCLLFPLPLAAWSLWKMVKAFIDPDTTKHIKVVSGAAADESPVPKKMLKYIDEQTMKRLESTRTSTFEGDLPDKKSWKKLFWNSH